MRRASHIARATFIVAWLMGMPIQSTAREREPEPAQVTLHAGRPGCAVELDAQTFGKTSAEGTLRLESVEPGDHYLHVSCPGEAGRSYLVSPRAGENLEVRAAPDDNAPPAAQSAGFAGPEGKRQLRGLIQQAVQLRAKGRVEEAVEKIREALRLDPENSDLHRELGITFLLGKEWKRARVEMLEALRHDPNDADAHNELGYALEKLGNLEAALKEYRIATRLEPDDPTYRRHYFDAIAKIQAQKAKK